MSIRTNSTTKQCGTTRVMRECRLDDHLKQSAVNTRGAEIPPRKINVNSKAGPKRTSSSVASRSCQSKSHVSERVRPHSDNSDRNNKTWFQVLLESPKKSNQNRILQTYRKNLDMPCRCRSPMNNEFETAKENFAPRSENTRRFNLLVDMLFDKISDTNDKNFLKIINTIRTLLDNPDHPYFGNENHARQNLLINDDKYNLQKPASLSNEKSNKSSDLLLKALLKETKDQREMLQSLNIQITQLREENKMLTQLKDARMNLESKLATRNTEMKYLRREYEKMKHLLEIRDKENENLRSRLSILKIAANGKMNHLFDNFGDQSIELIANPPTHETSFDMPIRPASSSPTENIQRNVNRTKKDVVLESSVNVSNAEEAPGPKNPANETKFKELKEDVNKFMEVLEADMVNLNANDLSLNLSDVTYKWSV